MNKHMPSNRVVVLVLASQTAVNQRDYKTQESTWALGAANVFFLRGKPSSKSYLLGQTLYVPCNESQENILRKTKLGVSWVLENFSCDYIVRANISCYIDMKNLESFLVDSLNSNNPEIGGFVEWHKNPLIKNSIPSPFISGAGIFMTRRAAIKLEELDLSKFIDIPDDVAITRFFFESGVTIRAMRRGNIHSTRLFFPQTHIRAKSSKSSELASKRLLLIHQYFISGKIRKISVFLKIAMLELKYALIERDNPMRYFQRNWLIWRADQLARKRDNTILLP